jgi:cytochrome c
MDPSIERGRVVAQLHCAACHAIGAAGASSSPMAPPFRIVRMRYNEITFERRMARLGEDGHSEMPNFTIDRADVDDVAAYIDSLRGR